MNLALNSDRKSILSKLFYEKTMFRKDQLLEKSIFKSERCVLSRKLNLEISALTGMDSVLLINELECKYQM